MIPAVACHDEAASRFVHARVRAGDLAEQRLGLAAARAHLDDLARHRYGHYLLKGLFVHAAVAVRRELLEAVCARDVVALCLHEYG